ncbi:MAG: hypothetical protein JNK53_01010 [Phycisphaerae bacterium]|nr:hypothetical protein [Phycisphaerae bacterium]
MNARALLGCGLGAALLAWGCAAPPPMPSAPPGPTSADLTAAELARVGGLDRLHARGVIELRTNDETGEHFDQGDLDLRWSRTLGLAASLSKLGDRWVWIGADATQWWIFELKSKPTRLHTGMLTSARSGLAPAFPWLMGVRPLLPAPSAEPERTNDRCRVRVQLPPGVLPAGAALFADFDAKTSLPVATELTLPGGGVWRSSLTDWMSVETAGVAQGAWPRVPRRALATNGTDDRRTTVRVSLDTARADAEATDRPTLYDLAGLRERFAPQEVETEE